MASSYALDKAFNTQLLNLLKELVRLYPNDSDMALIKHSVFIATTTMESQPRKVFVKSIEPYVSRIENKDETFFLNASNEEYLKHADQGTDFKGTSELIDKLKSMWRSMDKKTQKSVWLYLNVLVKLGFKDKEVEVVKGT